MDLGILICPVLLVEGREALERGTEVALFQAAADLGACGPEQRDPLAVLLFEPLIELGKLAHGVLRVRVADLLPQPEADQQRDGRDQARRQPALAGVHGPFLRGRNPRRRRGRPFPPSSRTGGFSLSSATRAAAERWNRPKGPRLVARVLPCASSAFDHVLGTARTAALGPDGPGPGRGAVPARAGR